jgi:DNA-binding GntR family transcriptional regulator
LRYRYIPITYNQQKVNTKQYQQILFQTNDEHHHIIECFENKDADGIENYIRDVHWATDYIDLL